MTSHAEQRAKEAAARFRLDHRLDVQPLGDLVALIEDATGYDVAILEAEPNEHGLSMRDPLRDVVFIGVARSRHPMRQRSTLAHELGHVLLDGWSGESEFVERSPDETLANNFARHLLIPIEGVKKYLGDRGSITEDDLSAIVQRFLVSPAMATIAMRDAGYVNRIEAQEWGKFSTRQLATRHGWSDYYAALQDDSDRVRAPRSLLSRAINGYVEGVVNAQVIATLRGTNVDTVLRDFDEAGIVPARYEVADMSVDDLPEIDVDLSDLDDVGTPS